MTTERENNKITAHCRLRSGDPAIKRENVHTAVSIPDIKHNKLVSKPRFKLMTRTEAAYAAVISL